MIRTRKKSVGREPSLRDQILDLLMDTKRKMTARDIAEHLSINKTTPFRPLADLVQMNLVIRHEGGLDGTEFSANESAVEAIAHADRRIKEKAD